MKATMKTAFTQSVPRSLTRPGSDKPGVKAWAGSAVALSILAGAVIAGPHLLAPSTSQAVAPPLPVVTVSMPVQRDVDTKLQFLGQFSAVDSVELRAQVGGTLTKIGFKDGDIVQKGDLLFVIDPTPYQIKLSEATAQLESAHARLNLASRELVRAQTLKRTGFGTIENADQRAADQRADQAAVDDAEALVRDARFDLDHCYITAPFTGRIGSHLVSVGNLIAGSRAASSPTTLLATLVSIDPIYLNFDMSEADYMIFSRNRARVKEATADKVEIALSDETQFARQGTLDFVDNVLNRSSGTIHARATVPNPNRLLTPGEFARVRLVVGAPMQALLVPDSAVLPDQAQHIVMTVAADGTVVPKQVEIGDLRGSLRVIRSGLTPNDQVIIDGIAHAAPGAKVAPHGGTIRYAAAGQEKS